MNGILIQTLLDNLVGMDYNGQTIIEARLLSNNESRMFTDVILVRYGQAINDKLFLHPAWVNYSYFSDERIELVEYPGYGERREYSFTK